jgi:hypothetical protein
MLPWAVALAKERMENNLKYLPISHCLPSGPVPLLGPVFFKLVQTPALVVMMFENDTPGYRQVFLDGRSHPRDFGPTWLGHSIGKCEGDTLVIELDRFRRQRMAVRRRPSATRTIRTCHTWLGNEPECGHTTAEQSGKKRGEFRRGGRGLRTYRRAWPAASSLSRIFEGIGIAGWRYFFPARFDAWLSAIPRGGNASYPITAGCYGIDSKIFRRRPPRRGSPRGVNGLRKYSTTSTTTLAGRQGPRRRWGASSGW